MIVGVPKETGAGERRVALVPAVVTDLTKAKLTVVVEAGAGIAAGYPDSAYEAKGARISQALDEVYAADVILRVRLQPSRSEDLSRLRRGQVVVGFMDPLGSPDGIRALAGTGATGFAVELVPRITRAQSMDALSSMATIAGYKAVILAADTLPQLFPMLMTAAGTIVAARVFVIGAGVAGLQAIATARRLGAVVEAYDVRPAVKEQVLSLGAKFVELPLAAGDAQDKGGYAKAMDEEFYRRQRETMARVVAQSDVVIATAAVPGRKAPVLITAAMVAGMKPGSVIVDLAAEQGGNCELTSPGESVVRDGVSVLGPVNIAASIPHHASQMYAKNVGNFIRQMVKDGALSIDTADEVLRETLVTQDGEVVSPKLREALGLPALSAATA
jgi:NAD(P) transhydrogenase subunit alpha